MKTQTFCPKCGAALSEHSHGQVCPRCALLGAISLGDETHSDAGGDAPHIAVDRDLGDYELLEEIGRGGMGVVFKARQKSLNRIVAVKMLLHGRFADPAFRRRFKLEAEATAHVEHPNIVPIHEIGEQAGQPFFSMVWIDGQSLDRELADGPIAPDRCARTVAILAQAVHQAHQHGVLHRDLKPHNVIIDADGNPHLTDFGLAKLLENDTGMTLTEAVLGSPGFTSPEQAAGQNAQVTTAADVFSLGAVLYTMLTGRPPFSGESPIATLHKVIECEPASPRALVPSLPRDLETICLKCLQKEPARRYRSADAFASDLVRWRKSEPIRARPVGQIERIRMWSRRHPWRAGLAAALIVAVLSGGIGIVSQWQRAERASRQAEAGARRAESNAYEAQISLARAQIQQLQPDKARQTLLQTGPEALRSWEWGWLMRECNQELMSLGTGSDRQTACTFTPDGRFIVTGCADGTVRTWETQTGALSRVLQGDRNSPVGALSLSHDGRSAITTHPEGPASVWNLTEATFAHALGQSGTRVTSATFSPDGTTIATGDANGNIQFWDRESGHLSRHVTQYEDGLVRALAFSPDGQHLAYSGGAYDPANQTPAAVCTLDLDTQSIRKFIGHMSSVEALEFSPDGEWLASAGTDGTIRMAAAHGDATFRLLMYTSGYEYYGLAFHQGGRQLAYTGRNFEEGCVNYIDLGTKAGTRRLTSYSGAFGSVDYAADGRTLAAACGDGRVSVIPVNQYPAYQSLEGHDGDVWALDVSPDGRYVASGSLDQTAKIWELETGRLIHTIHTQFPVIALAFTADGQHLVTTAQSNSAKVWPIRGGDAALELSGHGGWVTSVAVDPKGRWIATGSRDGKARLWDSGSGELLRTYSEHAEYVSSLAFSPDGERLATADRVRHALVRETMTGRQLCQMNAPRGIVTRIVFSPDGRLLATALYNGFARIWDAETGKAIGSPIKSGNDWMRWIAFSPDGKRLLTTQAGSAAAGRGGAGNKIVELWDIASRRRLWDFSPHNAPAFVMCFSPDGRRIITGGGDNTVRVWTAFPWMPEDYPDTESSPMESRLESFKRDYWSGAIRQPPSPNRKIESYSWGEKNVSRHVEIISSPSRPITPRASDTDENQIDLSTIYNAALDEVWQPIHSYFSPDLDLAALGPGTHVFEGVRFDIRGVIQLRRNDPRWMQFPAAVSIPVNRRFQRFHVVHSAVYYQPRANEGPTIGTYTLHYEDGGNAVRKIDYGIHLRTFLGDHDRRTDCERANLVWSRKQRSWGRHRLFKATYENPRPNEKVTHIEFRSTDTHTAPFLVGMTVE